MCFVEVGNKVVHIYLKYFSDYLELYMADI
jgi:hypothetical protein